MEKVKKIFDTNKIIVIEYSQARDNILANVKTYDKGF